MRIAFVHPTYWPEVQRGSERLIHDLGVALVARGHEVTLLTSHPGRPHTQVEDGVRVVRSWRPPQLPGLAAHEYHILNAPMVFARLARARYDVAHAFFPPDAYAAVRARRFGGPPVVATLHGVPVREYLVARRYRLEMLLRVAREAEECSVLSAAAATPFEAYLLRDPEILPGGVNASRFAVEVPPAAAPTLFFPASIGDSRKRGALLMRAFSRARRLRPELRLVAAPGRDPVMSPGRVELPDGAEFARLTDAELPVAYARSTVTALPAVHEAFGLVLIESMAAGTPVLVARSGAAPEVVEDGVTGVVVEPDDEDALVAGIGRALELAAQPETAERCRARALEFDWATLAGRYERVYRRAQTARA